MFVSLLVAEEEDRRCCNKRQSKRQSKNGGLGVGIVTGSWVSSVSRVLPGYKEERSMGWLIIGV